MYLSPHIYYARLLELKLVNQDVKHGTIEVAMAL